MISTHEFILNEGVTCTAEMVKSSELGKSVIEYAKKADVDLIMIMSQQDLAIAEWFIGSAAQEIINNSDVPVLSTRPMFRKDTIEYATS